MSFNYWGENRREEMFNLWKDHWPNHKPGFEMFTSPLRENADVVIMGYNPGGGTEGEYHDHMKPFIKNNPDFSLPEVGHYESGRTYPIANRLRNCVFHGKTHLFENCIETNRRFLRSTRKKNYKSLMDEVSVEIQKEYDQFCDETIVQLLNRADPEVIFDFSGDDVINTFRENYGFDVFVERRCISIDADDRDRKTPETEATVTIAELNGGEKRLISVDPHIAYRLSNIHKEFLKNNIPPFLPD